MGGDRPRWAFANAPFVIGGESFYDTRYLHNQPARSKRVAITEQSCDQTSSLDNVINLSSDDGEQLKRTAMESNFAARLFLIENSRSDQRRRDRNKSQRCPREGSHILSLDNHQQRGDACESLETSTSSSTSEWCMDRDTYTIEFGNKSRPDSSSRDRRALNKNMRQEYLHSKKIEENGGQDSHLHLRRLKAPMVSHEEFHELRSEKVESYKHGFHKVTDKLGALWAANKSQVPQLVQELENKLSQGIVECMICYDMVGRSSPIWSCASCYAIFHLSCIRKWARAPTSMDFSFASSNHAAGDGNWRCPGCQTVELVSAQDLRYHCFCGQVENPYVNHYLTPHSCGSSCKKTLDKSKTKLCNHYCTMKCHPGPCPPCSANAPTEFCPCGKKSVIRRCGEKVLIGSCKDVCGRTLLCGRHSCSQICHFGPCETCKVEVQTQCFCKEKQESLSCGQLEIRGPLDFEKGLFSCANPCPKLLSCGNHRCKEKCHPGQCKECELIPSELQTCPCGKIKLQDLVASKQGCKTCMDTIPTCSQNCGKLLPCKLHICQELCHNGNCPPCKVLVDQECCCGSSTRSIACCISQGIIGLKSKEENGTIFLCRKKCRHKKNCGRHKCNNRCCYISEGGQPSLQQDENGQNPHDCRLVCGKMLHCKQHQCRELCHSGNCPPCLESIFTELSCACGKTFIPPPVPCGTPLPCCQQPCSFTQACGHPPTHLCHFGDCPPCVVPISKECVGKHVILRGVPCGSRHQV